MSRIEQLLKKIECRSMDAFFLLKHETVTKQNVRYISGFTGSSAHLIISPRRRVLLTDERYTEQAADQCPDFEVIGHERQPEKKMWEVLESLKIKRMGYEPQSLTVKQFNLIQESTPGIEWIPTTGIIEELRAVKQPEEIHLLEKATDIAAAGFKHILNKIKTGVREQDIALELELFMRKNGAEGPAFTFVFVSGTRSSLQHGDPTEKEINRGDFVTIDFGAMYEGYRSDITRTLAVRPVSDKQREIYNLVHKALERGLKLIKPGLSGGELYREVQKIITEAGYEDYSGQGIGHGVGLEIHERPFIRAGVDTELKIGHVLTIEPGIYIPGWGGVRIEDTVVVEKHGCRVLTKIPKDLIIL
jgi:Xaa-Pro aminopeptidase